MSVGIRRARSRFAAILFGGPALIGLTMFLALPFLMALILTFTDRQLVSPDASQFVGLRNYERLLSVTTLVQHPVSVADGQDRYIRIRDVTRTDPAYRGYRPLTSFAMGERRVTVLARDPAFLRALGNTFLFAVLVVPLQCVMALGLALLVNAGLRGQTFFRAVYFSPVVMSMVIVSVIWSFLFDRDLGLFNQALSLVSFGLIPPIDWLGDPRAAMPAIVIMSAWQGAGFQMLILLAGLQGIAQELYDAARIDGATAWQRFVHITIPGLRNTITFVLIVTTIAALGLFTQVDVMTGGGPRGSTATVMFEAVRRGVREQNISYGATISLIYFAIITLFILFQQLVLRRRQGAKR